MKARSKNFIKFFVIPILVSGVLYTILNVLYPVYFSVWIGLLMSAVFSATIKVWSELHAAGERFETLKEKFTGELTLYDNYLLLMEKAEKVVTDPKNRLETVFVYMGYGHLPKSSYMKGTLKAIEKKRIDRYFRILTIRRESEIEDTVEFLRQFLVSDRVRRHSRIFISYRPAANYISFLTVGDKRCIIAFPDLMDEPGMARVHKCGINSNQNRRLIESLKETFQEIRKQPYVKMIHLEKYTASEEDRQKMEDEIREQFRLHNQP